MTSNFLIDILNKYPNAKIQIDSVDDVTAHGAVVFGCEADGYTITITDDPDSVSEFLTEEYDENIVEIIKE